MTLYDAITDDPISWIVTLQRRGSSRIIAIALKPAVKSNGEYGVRCLVLRRCPWVVRRVIWIYLMIVLVKSD